jgi:urea carboxylase-associated protein 2
MTGATNPQPPTRKSSPPSFGDDRLVLRETLRGGSAWSRRIARHQVLRLVDPVGRACVSALFYNAHAPLERYNMPDTLKAQYTAFLSQGRVLYSDMGRVLCSVIADSCGHHDTLTGCGDAQTSFAMFGTGSYQELRNDFYRNARDNFLVELAKHGLGKRDIVANVNFFVAVDVDERGQLSYRVGNSHAGAHVDLRFEIDTLVVLTNTPHPLDPHRKYEPADVELTLYQGEPPRPEDPCRTSRAENGRGFQLSEAYARDLAAMGATRAGMEPR